MKKIGILLPFLMPNMDLKNEGISRLLGFMLQKGSEEIVIFLPEYSRAALEDLMNDLNVQTERYEIVTMQSLFWLRVHKWLIKYQKKKKVKGVKKHSKDIKLIDRYITFVLSQTTPFFAILSIIPIIVIAPLFFIGLALYKKTTAFFKKCFPKKVKQSTSTFSLKAAIKQITGFNFLLPKMQRSINIVFAHQANLLVQSVNRREDIGCVYIPSLGMGDAIKQLAVPVVLAAPDIVFQDFPLSFVDNLFERLHIKIISGFSYADHFITYSQHVKDTHLVKPHAIDPDKISVISHGHIDLSPYLLTAETNLSVKDLSIELMQNFQKKKKDNPYFSSLNLSSLRYIFYSSHNRPHKNILQLIKAYHILLRKKYVTEKLLLTSTLDSQEIFNYIQIHRLQYDIISIPKLSSAELAAFNANATCSVNPSLFEGGFPFTFSEAYSVGTPSIMAAIPAVEEILHDDALKEKMLFDPYSLQSMVDKIYWGINNRSLLFELQKPLYEQFKARSWSLVAEEYYDVFRKVIDSSATLKKK